MTTERTLIVSGSVSASSIGSAIWPPPLIWPEAEPGDNLDYYLDVTQPLAAVNDSIAHVAVAITPVGTSEMTADALGYAGYVIGLRLAGGIAGRLYTVVIQATGKSGRIWQWNVKMPIGRTFMQYPPPLPTS